jgi:hypothetical protein
MVEKLMKAVIATGLASCVVFGGGCLTRPVEASSPTTKTSFQAEVKQQSIDKVDLLFAIDNSASMGDKQDLLAAAVPVLVSRLLNPNCVDTNTADVCTTAANCTGPLGANAQCDVTGNGGAGQCFVPGDGSACSTVPNTKAEFDAVHDMHIGIVSSSLGGGGSPDICVESNPDTTHQNDHGQLLNRTLVSAGPPPVEGSISNAKPLDGNGGNFLAWLPQSNPKNAGKTPPNVTYYNDGQAGTTAPYPPGTLVGDFQALVEGVQQHGCGLEAQLESWYHFLIQPDPWDTITLDSSNPPKAILGTNGTGVDATVLKMRHDFLRPDSLVAIIQVTDEEDSWSDPLWLGGYGWTARTQSFPGGPGQGAGPIGTSECNAPVNINTSPPTGGSNDPDCTSCAFPSSTKPVSGTPIGQDPNCMACAPGATTCPQMGWYTPAGPSVPITAADGVNVRYSRQIMRSKYGFDNQFNYNRYVDGLRLPNVPDRNNESHDSTNYAPTRNCVNPLFAESLPDGSDVSPGTLCTLTPGSRTPDLVFYAIIGGVPNQLLTDSNGNFKLNLQESDWTAILGSNPDYYVFDGIDPHMIQSTAPRQGLEAPPAPTGSYNLGTDPDNGREWNTLDSTAAIDLQYACVFDLPTPKDCTAAVNQNACDCTGTAASAADGPPLCSTTTRTTQIKGKAYPQSRYQLVAKALGSQAVVASICAQVVTGNTDDPAYGYNGAMQAIVNRLKSALSGQCLPQQLQAATNGAIPCLILIEYPSQTNQAAGCTDPGMTQPTSDVLTRFDQTYLASLGDAGAGMSPPVVCVFNQLIQGTDYTGATCEGSACTSANCAGWCYVSGAANTGGCAQAIKFGGAGPPAGTVIDLECIEAQGDSGN